MSETDKSSISSATYETDNTTAADHLDDIDITAYMLADSITAIHESVAALTARFEYYKILNDICEEISKTIADPANYFETVYLKLTT